MVRCIIALHISQPTIRNAFNLHVNSQIIFVQFLQTFVKKKKPPPQYQISRKSVRWEPEDIQTDGHDEASGRLGSAGNPSDRSRQDKTT